MDEVINLAGMVTGKELMYSAASKETGFLAERAT